MQITTKDLYVILTLFFVRAIFDFMVDLCIQENFT